MKSWPTHKLLPRAVQDALRDAARVDSRRAHGMSNERIKVLDAVIRKARQLHPGYFR